MDRNQKIIRTSIIGIGVNLILVVFKMIVGILSNSIAVILDAVNNLGDALSSIITIIGTKLAGKAPDKKHPYGYGRIEYLASVLIAAIVLMTGISSARESIESILHPAQASYSAVALVIIAVAALAKFLCGRYVKGVGEQIHANSLIASGSDAFFDSILSIATLIAALVNTIWHISLEGILGLIISVVIIKAGFEMLMETLDSIIGVRADRSLSEELKAKVNSFVGVRGAYDLTLHNYGPTEIIGSVHIEVEDTMTARDIHSLSRQITEEVYRSFGIILTVGIYASNTSDEETLAIKSRVENILQNYPSVLQMHGFYMDLENKAVSFDLVLDFEADRKEVHRQILSELEKDYPKHHFHIVHDSDYSD